VRARSFLASVGLPSLLLCALTPAGALPPPQAPLGRPASSPTPAPAGATLPLGSRLLFVLDDKIDSRSTKPGTTIRMHLQSALILNGTTIAPEGAPATIEIVNTRKAATGDEDGSVQIHLDPFTLPGLGLELPIRALKEYLTMERSAGQLSTRDTTDTIGDIFIPWHVLYRAFRPGQQYVLQPGTVMQTETGATIDASNPHGVVLSTPLPFKSTYDPPHSDLTAQPLYTPAPARPRPLPRGKPTLPPTPAPTDTPAAAATDQATSPAATGAPSAAAATPAAPAATAAPSAGR
jgi:hypothetical protein